MRFLPLTRQVELDIANPEKVISGFPGAYFYREGNDRFYLIRNNVYQRIDIKKRSFTLAYQNQTWFPNIQNYNIVFSEPYELWIKQGDGNNAIGWKFVAYKSLRIEELIGQSPTPTPTIGITPSITPSISIEPTPTPTTTPTVTPAPSETPTPTPTTTPTVTPSNLGTIASDDFEEYTAGTVTSLIYGTGPWESYGYFTSSFYATGSDDFELYSFGTITTLTSGSGWDNNGQIF